MKFSVGKILRFKISFVFLCSFLGFRKRERERERERERRFSSLFFFSALLPSSSIRV